MRPLLLLIMPFVTAGCGGHSTEDWLGQLKDADVVKRREAIRELGERTDDAERIVPALTQALHDTNEYVRHDAAIVLGEFGPRAKEAVPNLLVTLKDRDRGVRKAAAQALQKIDPPTAAKILPTNRGR